MQQKNHISFKKLAEIIPYFSRKYFYDVHKKVNNIDLEYSKEAYEIQEYHGVDIFNARHARMIMLSWRTKECDFRLPNEFDAYAIRPNEGYNSDNEYYDLYHEYTRQNLCIPDGWKDVLYGKTKLYDAMLPWFGDKLESSLPRTYGEKLTEYRPIYLVEDKFNKNNRFHRKFIT